MRIKAKYDQIVGWRRGEGYPGDDNYVPAGDFPRQHHFTFGKPGDPVSGGFYIMLGVELPGEITITIPDITKETEHGKERKAAEAAQRVQGDEGAVEHL